MDDAETEPPCGRVGGDKEAFAEVEPLVLRARLSAGLHGQSGL